MFFFSALELEVASHQRSRITISSVWQGRKQLKRFCGVAFTEHWWFLKWKPTARQWSSLEGSQSVCHCRESSNRKDTPVVYRWFPRWYHCETMQTKFCKGDEHVRSSSSTEEKPLFVFSSTWDRSNTNQSSSQLGQVYSFLLWRICCLSNRSECLSYTSNFVFSSTRDRRFCSSA